MDQRQTWERDYKTKDQLIIDYKKEIKQLQAKLDESKNTIKYARIIDKTLSTKAEVRLCDLRNENENLKNKLKMAEARISSIETELQVALERPKIIDPKGESNIQILQNEITKINQTYSNEIKCKKEIISSLRDRLDNAERQYKLTLADKNREIVKYKLTLKDRDKEMEKSKTKIIKLEENLMENRKEIEKLKTLLPLDEDITKDILDSKRAGFMKKIDNIINIQLRGILDKAHATMCNQAELIADLNSKLPKSLRINTKAIVDKPIDGAIDDLPVKSLQQKLIAAADLNKLVLKMHKEQKENFKKSLCSLRLQVQQQIKQTPNWVSR